jgi:hypothetical protein
LKLKLERTWCGAKCTIGTLYLDGVAECFTLEDVVRPGGVKVYGETAIPPGAFNVVVTKSQRFQRDLDGIRIHPGNDAADTDGCILVGRTKGVDFVGESRAAFNVLFAKIQKALAAGEKITLEIA